jgi:hypothetical protein
MSYELKRLTRALAAAGAAAGITAVLVTAAGCGKEGPPTPPFRALPAPTTDLAAHERGTHVVLSFKYPQTTPGGQALNGLSKVEVWEAVVTPEPPKPPKPEKSDKSKKDAKNPADTKGTSATSTGTSATMPGSTASATPTTGATPATSAATSTTATSTTTTTATSGSATPTGTATPSGAATTPAGIPATPGTAAPGTAATLTPAPGTPDPLDTKLLGKLAKLKLTLTTKDIAAATLGSRIVVDLPLPEPLPVLPPTAATAAGATSGTAASGMTGATGATGTTGTTAASGATGTTAASGATGATGAAGTAGFTATAAANAPRLPIHYYVVRTFGPQGDRSEFSNQAILVARVGPAAPEGVTVTAEAEDIRVEWKSVPEAGGYAIYRRAATERFNSQPLAVVRAPGDSYLDTKAEFGQSYIYSVTALDAKDPLIESAIKAEQEIHYVDKFPPPVPEELVTVAETAKVRLVWRQVEAGDLAGYVVYRKSSGGDFTRLTAQPIGGTNYIDATAVSGQSYDYRVSAIDKTGNESAPSAEVHVAVP